MTTSQGGSAIKLSRKEWERVLSEATVLARRLEARKHHLEQEYRGLEDPLLLEARLTVASAEGKRFLKERIEVHIGTIQIMRPIRSEQHPLIPIPEEIRQGIGDLIGPDAIRSLSEVKTWQR